MFIREIKTRNKKTGAVYKKHVLIESYRSPDGPRQRVLMHLGTVRLRKELWPLLAAELERRLSGRSGAEQLALLDLDGDVAFAADRAVAYEQFQKQRKLGKEPTDEKKDLQLIDLNSAATSFSRSLGPELLGHHFWQDLKMPEILADHGLSPRQRSLAEAVVLGRLIHPGSDLNTWRWIRHHSSIAELVESNLARTDKDSVYEIADCLLQHKRSIEDHLLWREKNLFPERQSLYLLDLTNFYFEGKALGNRLAKRGKSKQKRSDCPLVTLALVVDSAGFPIVSRVYQGNVGEPSTLKEILHDMGYDENDKQLEIPLLKPALAMDRGIATQDNLAYIRQCGFPYVIIERAPREKEYADPFAQCPESFERIERHAADPVWVRKVDGPDPETARVLCKSEGRVRKEQGIAQRWEKRAADDIERLSRSIERGRLRKADRVYTRIGRLKERYPGFDKRFSLTCELTSDGKNAIALVWRLKDNATEQKTKPLPGCYVIETSYRSMPAVDIWNLYMTLSRVEASFRSMKSDLGTRPLFHQLAVRTESHLFLSVLAYHLLINIEYRLAKSGDTRRWDSIREVLGSHRRNTIILRDDKGVIYHIRQSGQPETAHADIYAKLGVRDPLRKVRTEFKSRT
jgi:transposase